MHLNCVYNNPNPLLADIVLAFPFEFPLNIFARKRFQQSYNRERFAHPYKECSFPSPIDARSHNPPSFEAQHPCWHTLIRSLVSLLAHRLVSNSDIICNGSNPSVANIVLFGLLLKIFLNASTSEKFPYPYKKMFVPLSNRYSISHCVLGFLFIVGNHRPSSSFLSHLRHFWGNWVSHFYYLVIIVKVKQSN